MHIITAVFLEGVFWVCFHNYIGYPIVMKSFEKLLKQNVIWEQLHLKKGGMTSNQAEDCVHLFGACFQHLLAASFIFFGAVVFNLPRLVQTGIICEWGFQLADLFNLIFKTGSHKEYQVNSKYAKHISAHHFAGITSGVAISLTNYHTNIHIQRVCMIMLVFGGAFLGFNVIFGNIGQVLHVSPKMLHMFDVIDVAFCRIICRFLLFPYEVILLIQEMAREGYPVLAVLILIATMFMTLFNFQLIKGKVLMMNHPERTTRKGLALKKSSSSMIRCAKKLNIPEETRS